MQPHAWPLVCEANKQHAAANGQQNLKEVIWLVIDHDAISYLCSDLWTGELAVKVILHVIIHS